MKRTYPILMLSLLLLPLAACGSGKSEPSSGPVTGQILEAGTKKPIGGVIVLVRWLGIYSLPFARPSCYHVETATTDAEGRFHTEAWRAPKAPPEPSAFTLGSARIDAVYKAGYETYWPPGFDRTQDYKQNIYYLAPFKGAREDRVGYLMHLSNGADCYGADEKPLFPLQKALYQEAKNLAFTPQDQDSVQWIKHRAVRVWRSSKISLTDSESEALIRNDNFLSEQLK